MNNGPDITKALDEVAAQLQTLADRAVPTANRLASIIRVGGFLGLLGGLVGAAAISLPGFGFIRSWPFFLLLAAVASVCALVVFRWAKHLRSWTGDVKHVVGLLRDVPSPGRLVEELRVNATALVKHDGKPDSGRSAVMNLVRTGIDLRKRLRELPGMADKAKDVFVQLTGPFRPPLLGLRFAMLVGGLAMVLVGPFLALLAAAF